MSQQTMLKGTDEVGYSGAAFDVDSTTMDLLNATTAAAVAGIGAAAGTGVAASETICVPNKTTLQLTAASITVTDATTAGAHGSLKVYDFPAGLVHIVGCITDLQITAGSGGIGDTAAVVASVGTVTTVTDNATLTTTEANIVPSITATLTGGAGNADGESTGSATFDGTATAIDMYLNFAVPDAGSSANDTLAVTGTIIFVWYLLGDN